MIKTFLFVSFMALTPTLFAQTNPQNDRAIPFRLGGTTPLTSDAGRPIPRMPDGTVDLWGTWVGGGETDDIEAQGGLKPGTLDAIMLPSAKKLMASRTVPQDPHNFCLDRKSTRLNSSHSRASRMPSSA